MSHSQDTDFHLILSLLSFVEGYRIRDRAGEASICRQRVQHPTQACTHPSTQLLLLPRECFWLPCTRARCMGVTLTHRRSVLCFCLTLRSVLVREAQASMPPHRSPAWVLCHQQTGRIEPSTFIFTLSFPGREPYGKANSEMLLPGMVGQATPDLNLLAISSPDLSTTKMIF